MQTKQQIKNLLLSATLSPNKRKGQNFLIDLNLMRLLVDLADLKNSDTVLEVGCGTGSLTGELCQRAGAVIVAEIEQTLADITRNIHKDKQNLQIFTADILKNKNTIAPNIIGALTESQAQLGGRRLKLVANLPYSIATPVIAQLVTGLVTADSMYVTIQKEVAERMTAKPGTKHYGKLSIILASAGDVKLERILKPTVFWPQPKVDSAMVSFIRNKNKLKAIHNMELFSQIVNLFMQHRRKMLKACTKLATAQLAEIHNWNDIFQRASIDPQKRPDQLEPQAYIAISNLCNEFLQQR